MRNDFLSFYFTPQSSLLRLFEDLNLHDLNHVEIFCETIAFQSFLPPIIKSMGVHVECICHPLQNSGIFHENYEVVHPNDVGFSYNDIGHLSLPSDVGLPMDMANDLGLGQQDLGFDSIIGDDGSDFSGPSLCK